jgi:beta-galactosidase
MFDGVYMDADVWINGVHLGNHPYGYTAFSFDLTKHLLPRGEDNVLSVKVKNLGKNSRWYSGSGIYRHVWLIKTEAVHFSQWGTFVSTSEVSDDVATVKVESDVINESGKDEEITLSLEIIDSLGNIVGKSEVVKQLLDGEEGKDSQTITIEHPALWSPDSPSLYKLKSSIARRGKIVDQTVTDFGIRSIDFSTEKGFLLNGKSVLLKGACMHHDNGPLGAAAIDRAEYRRVEIMKANGYNAIRASHNPPSKQFLDACDKLGMLVMNESFDQWEGRKNKQDYHRFFYDWWERDIESMVLRDRNHPSVIIWSIGNEIPERAHPKGLKITKMLKKKVKELDPGRPVTEAICCGRWEKTAPAFALLDLHGYNYRWYKYESDHEQYPERIVIGTESYAKEALENWEMVEKYPWVVGDFVWTGMDYLGESGLGHTRLDNEPSGHLMHWPWFNAWCGDIDLIGFKKPQSYYRDVVWKESKLEMMVYKLVPEGRLEVVSGWGWPDEYPHWNWNGHEGENMQVSVYSRCDEVRLEINGEVIGTKSVSVETNLTATFDVPFQAGELKAIGLVDGKEVVEKVFETTGQPAKIRLTPDRNKISANRNDLAYVTVEVVDEGNNLVPNADMPVNFSVKGEGELIAVGNGNPADMKNFQSAECTTFNGRCILVIRPFNKSGEIEVSATNIILSSTSIIIQTD